MRSTRRDFLRAGAAAVAGLAAGCERMSESLAGPNRGSTEDRRDTDRSEVQALVPQQQPSPLVFAGDRLAQLRDDALVVRRTSDLSEELTIPVKTPQGLGVLSGEVLAVLEATAEPRLVTLAPGASRAARHRGLVPTAFRFHSRIFAGPKAGTAVVATRSGEVTVDLCQLIAPDRLRRRERMVLEPNDFETLTALGGGFGFASVREGGLVRVYFAGTTSVSPLAEDMCSALHVVAGPRPATAWVSGRGGLRLISLGERTHTIASVVPAGGAIIHLARAGRRVVALLVDETASGRVPSLAVFDQRGHQVWRTRLSLPDEVHFAPRWVAGSRTQVAVGHATELAVFDAASGVKL
jgi:hypothetical protein